MTYVTPITRGELRIAVLASLTHPRDVDLSQVIAIESLKAARTESGAKHADCTELRLRLRLEKRCIPACLNCLCCDDAGRLTNVRWNEPMTLFRYHLPHCHVRAQKSSVYRLHIFRQADFAESRNSSLILVERRSETFAVKFCSRFHSVEKVSATCMVSHSSAT